jgi:hypothetical protein
LLSSTYIGTDSIDWINSIFIGKNNEVVLVGVFQEWQQLPVNYNFSDESIDGVPNLCVLRMSPLLDSVLSVTVLGPSWDVSGTTDSLGNIIVVGNTFSKNFPTTPESYDTSYNGGTSYWKGDIFILKLNPTADSIYFSTFLGGSGEDSSPKFYLDDSDNIFIFGMTSSTDFPLTENAFETMTSNLFISILSGDGKHLLASTYFTGEFPGDILVTGNGDVVVSGSTGNTNHPTTENAHANRLLSNTDAFINILNSDLSEIKYGTFIGGTNEDYSPVIKLDNDQNLIAISSTKSTNFPVSNNALYPYNNGGFDACIYKFNLTEQKNNNSPQIANILKDTIVYLNENFSYYIADSVFIDNDEFDFLTYKATLTNGEELPGWIKFSNSQMRFYGIPSEEDTLTIRLTATDNNLESVSDEFQLLIIDRNTLIDRVKRKGVILYPNPAKNYVTIDDDSQVNDFSYSIIDMQGKVCKSGRTHKTIEINSLSRGTYLLTYDFSNIKKTVLFTKE